MATLKKLNIKNFESHCDTTIDFSKVNIITGKNGEGKSSIINALMFALSGDLPTKPYQEYIKNEEESARVELEMDISPTNTGKITRKIINKDATKTEGVSTNKLAEQIGTTPETLRTLADTWFFVRYATSSSRRNVLSSVLSRKYTLEELLECISERDPLNTHKDFVVENYDILNNPKKSQMEVLYKLAYDRRATVKKQKESIDIQISSLENKLSAYADIPTEIDEAMLARTSKHSSIKTSISYETTSLDSKRLSFKQYSDKLDEMRHTRGLLVAKLDEKKTTKDEVSALSEQMIIIKSQLQGLNNNLSLILKDSVVECPVCGNPLTGVEEKLRDKIKEKTQAISNLETILTTKKDTLDLQNKITEIDSLLAGADKKLQTMKADISNTEDKILQMNTELTKLEELGILDKAGIDASKNQTEVLKMKGALSTLRDQQSSIIDEINLLNTRVDLFNDKSIWTKLLSYNRELFVTKLTETVKLLIPKYNAIINDELDIIFDGISINTLSESEKFRVGISIQAALSIASGTGILLIDGSDIVTDPTNVIEYINKLGSMDEIKTMIITSSIDFTKTGSSHTAVIDIPASHFVVENGVVRKEQDIVGTFSW